MLDAAQCWQRGALQHRDTALHGHGLHFACIWQQRREEATLASGACVPVFGTGGVAGDADFDHARISGRDRPQSGSG